MNLMKLINNIFRYSKIIYVFSAYLIPSIKEIYFSNNNNFYKNFN